MVDALTIGGALSSLKTASDIAKALVTLRDESAIRSKVIDLQSAILAAQSDALSAQAEQMQMRVHVRELEEEVARVTAWERERSRYTLTELGKGVFVYLLKANERGNEPVHCLCTNCYEHGRKSILQNTKDFYGMIYLQCPSCKAEVIAEDSHPNYPYAKNRHDL